MTIKYIYKRFFFKVLFIVFLFFGQKAYVCSQYVSTPLSMGGSVHQSIGEEAGEGVLTAGFHMVEARRTFELALALDSEQKVNGAEFVHKFFVNKKGSADYYNIRNFTLRPYAMYNLIYQRAESVMQKKNTVGDLNNVPTSGDYEKVTTIHHFLGFGIEKDILQNLYVDLSTSAGYQLGKNNYNNKIDGSADQRQENGFIWNVKFGFGYRL